MGAGDFSASQMPGVLLKQHEIFNKGRINSRRGNTKLHTTYAILENQTARTSKHMVNGECRGVEIAWIRGCDKNVIDNSETPMSCDIGGTELESKSEVVAPNFFLYRDRVVTNKQCNDLFTYEDKLAEALISMKQEIEEELNSRVFSTLVGNISPVSDYEGVLPYGWSEDEDAYVFPSDHTKREQVIAEMGIIAEMNRIPYPIIIGDATWKASTALAKYLNKEGGAVYDEAGLHSDLGRWYFDAPSLNSIGSEYGKMLVIDPTNVLLWTINDYEPGLPKEFGDNHMKVWAEPSMNHPQLKFDAMMTSECVMGDSGMPRISTNIRLVLRGGIMVGPGDCSETDTGIIYMKQNLMAESM